MIQLDGHNIETLLVYLCNLFQFNYPESNFSEETINEIVGKYWMYT